jgi:hypothetical protein
MYPIEGIYDVRFEEVVQQTRNGENQNQTRDQRCNERDQRGRQQTDKKVQVIQLQVPAIQVVRQQRSQRENATRNNQDKAAG